MRLNNLHQKLFLLLVLLIPTQLGLHFWPEWATIFGIRVDYLSPTIYLTDLIVVGMLVSWVIEKRVSNLQSIFKSKFSNLWLALFIYLIITSIFVAQNQGVALYKLAKIVEFSLLGFYIYKNWKLEMGTPPGCGNWKFSAALAAAVAYSSLLAWAQFLTGHTIGFWILGERTFDVMTPGIALVTIGGQDHLRPYATFPHPNVLAGFLLIGIILLSMSRTKLIDTNSNFQFPHPGGVPISNFKNFKFRIAKTFLIFTLLFSLSALIITFSHSAWIAGVAALFVGCIPALRGRLVLITKSLLLILITGSFLMPFAVRNQDLSREVGQRLELARSGLFMFGDYPLTGVGLNNFIVRLPEYGGDTGISWWLQPVHNIFLLVLVETGIIGFILFIWFLFLTIKKLPTTNYQLLTIFLVILITGMLDHYWLTLQQGQLLTTLVLGLLFAGRLADGRMN